MKFIIEIDLDITDEFLTDTDNGCRISNFAIGNRLHQIADMIKEQKRLTGGLVVDGVIIAKWS